MRFTVRPVGSPESSREGFGGSSVHLPPEWLTEWIANKGRYALLSCGHKEDINHNTILVVGRDHSILCAQCDEWSTVEKRLTFNEYVDLPPHVIPDEPLF